MRLVRYGTVGAEMPGLLDKAGNLRDARPWVSDWRGTALAPELLAELCQRDESLLPLVTEPMRYGPCISGVGKVIGIALNYQLHAVETGARPTTEPNLFLKATSALSGADDPIPMPRGGSKLDWEVELGVVIGRTAVNIAAPDAASVIAGYCLLNDVSERAFQIERGGQQHTKGKSAAGFCPIGPWLLTADAVPNPQALSLWTEVNGVRMQDGSTAQMSVGVFDLVAYCSEFMTLEPGDIIASGTPAGVGHGMKPPRYLAVGDRVVLGGSGLGEQHHSITALA
ncbi:MAG: fumarylacetoacetate hydrolase family protein [Alphaproteobacteria bacterium]|nr:fumarylacetoacetate hydrolase family protein [Alphaproteobacteria bacterium]